MTPNAGLLIISGVVPVLFDTFLFFYCAPEVSGQRTTPPDFGVPVTVLSRTCNRAGGTASRLSLLALSHPRSHARCTWVWLSDTSRAVMLTQPGSTFGHRPANVDVNATGKSQHDEVAQIISFGFV